MFYRLDFEFASDTVMEYQRIVAPGEGHRNRAQNVQPEISSVLDRCNSLKNTIVRLQFMFGGKAVPCPVHTQKHISSMMPFDCG
jgi:hypothetical protein